jgi:hypothetical protein
MALVGAVPRTGTAGQLPLALTCFAGVLTLALAALAFHLTRPEAEQPGAFTASSVAAAAAVVARDGVGGVKVVMPLRVGHGFTATAFGAFAFSTSAARRTFGFSGATAFTALERPLSLAVRAALFALPFANLALMLAFAEASGALVGVNQAAGMLAQGKPLCSLGVRKFGEPSFQQP